MACHNVWMHYLCLHLLIEHLIVNIKKYSIKSVIRFIIIRSYHIYAMLSTSYVQGTKLNV